MATMTHTEIRDTIVNALGDRAKLLRRDAASRQHFGPARAEMRALIRAEAKRCEDLQRILGHADPDKLASALEARPKFAPGDKAIWTGSADLFERPVTIADVRPSGLLIFGEHPGTGPLIYDIHDAEVVKGIIYGIPAGQLHPRADEEG